MTEEQEVLSQDKQDSIILIQTNQYSQAQSYDPEVVARMSTEYKQILSEASRLHSSYISAIARKGQFNPSEVARCAQRAEDLYGELLNRDCENTIVIYQLATLYMQTNRNGLAIRLLKHLTDNYPARIEWVNNIGTAYRNENYRAEAKEWFERALKMDYHPDVLANLCALWVNEGYPERGIPYGRQSLALQPNHKDAEWNLGLLLLENKEYEEGFALYAKGMATGQRTCRNYLNMQGDLAPLWNGENPSGQVIVFHGEQGIGDELLFMQFVPEFIKKYPAAELVLDCHPRLCSAIQRAFPTVRCEPTRKTDPVWNKDLRVSFKDGVGSLPKWFHTKRRKNAGWLTPEPQRAEKYRLALEKLNPEKKPIIGIAWQGGKKKTRGDLRSIPLENWLPILKNDCFFVSLDYNPGSEFDTGNLLKEHGIVVHHWPDVVQDTDYEETIALASVCDLVISINTSLVHVMGSMDRPCWTCTPHGHAWRYGKKDTINPFYVSVKQYHQNEDGEWEHVIQKVADDLAQFMRKRKAA